MVVPDIGAFPERVAGRALSAVMPWNLATSDWIAFWRELQLTRALPAAPQGTVVHAGDTTLDNAFYAGGYLQPVTVRAGELSESTADSLVANYYLVQSGLSLSERLLRRIWRLSRSPLVAKGVALIPFRLKQSFKRRLSSRPMHDIVHKE